MSSQRSVSLIGGPLHGSIRAVNTTKFLMENLDKINEVNA